ncbi:MAG: hypothetical protein P0Y59_21690 [Candidatus Sphingomonas phytovorans]|nr:hypothetical protein [Sphingomonas sp.]WEJ99494.1 MAG: hypothetical protein P0Y59_21690 [Sphingomonas sp.]
MLKLCLVSINDTPPPEGFVKVVRGLGEVAELSFSRSEMLDECFLGEAKKSSFDRHIFWQADALVRSVQPLALARTFIVPDISFPPIAEADWRGFVSCRFLALTRTQHEALQRTGCASSHFQYYLEPLPVSTIDFRPKTPTARFVDRERTNGINLKMITTLCRALGIPSLNVLASPDAGPQALELRSGPSEGVDVRIVTTLPSQEECSIHFSSPPAKGLDTESIDAMANGCLVISPDTTAMRDYMAPSTSGIFYDPVAPLACLPELDQDKIAAIRRAALRKASFGHLSWAQDRARLASIIADDGSRWGSGDYSAAFTSAIRHAAYNRLVHA